MGEVINVSHRQHKQGGRVFFFLLISIIITILAAACNNRIMEEAGNGVDACNSVHCCTSCGHAQSGFCAFRKVCSPVATTNGFRNNFTRVSLHLSLICCHVKEHVVGEVPQLACLRMVGLQ